MNSTAPFAHPSADVLYAGTDMSKLSFLETQWVAWYTWINNPVLATGLASFLLHEVCRALLLRSTYVGSNSFLSDRLLRSLHTMDHHRRDPVLQEVEAAADEGSYCTGAMGVHEAGALEPFHD